MKACRLKEPVNALTHFSFFLAGIVGLVLLILYSRGSISKIVTMSIFGTSVIILYGASTLYHWLKTTPKREYILRKIDHGAIFVLIAGTYTPILYYGLEGAWRWVTLGVIWTAALVGVSLKIALRQMPRTLSTVFYVTLGWMAVIPFFKFIGVFPTGALTLLLAGGLVYTLGGIIYATKIFDFFPKRFGFHEVFHLFVMGGTLLHYLMIGIYIIPI
ncbi:MAG: hemolysin III family protein [Bacillota bacterium]